MFFLFILQLYLLILQFDLSIRFNLFIVQFDHFIVVGLTVIIIIVIVIGVDLRSAGSGYVDILDEY